MPADIPELLQVRAPALCSYVLRDAAGLTLLDSGFIGGRALLRRALARRGWAGERIRGIVVTHGHLDHILHVAALAREHGAWIAAPRGDAEHYAGRAVYDGWARVTGALERVGRRLLPWEPFVADRLLDDGDELEVWGGLRAVHLPGHTHGHTGYYSERLRVMFTGDLFTLYRGRARLPPAVFNSAPGLLWASVARVLAFPLRGVVPNHCDRSTAAAHLAALRRGC